ncbi:hypothetical protein J6590_076288 [Homalodisca vitripennis]|nr:hypothetical protein J6590_076288 [Homalodisca vitripennis]
MRVSHRPTLNSNYKEFCRVNFELLRVLYRPNLNSFTSFQIIESSADKTSNYCVFKISLSSAREFFKGPAFSFELPRVLNYRMFELSRFLKFSGKKYLRLAAAPQRVRPLARA